MYQIYFKPQIKVLRYIFLSTLFIYFSFLTPPPDIPKEDDTKKVSNRNIGYNAFELYGIKINFQDKDSEVPNGFFSDYGKAFGTSSVTVIGNTYTYGWKSKETEEPIDISSDAPNNDNGSGRNRLGNDYANATIQQKIEGTLMHMQGDNVMADGEQIWAGQPRGNEAYWEIEVPNGFYFVDVSAGDAGGSINSKHSIAVEGYTIISAFTPSEGQIKLATMLVEVTDGALTVNALGGYNTKINYITIEETFDDEDSVNGELAFTPNQESVNFYINDDVNPLTTSLAGTNAESIGFVIDDDMAQENDVITESNDWLNLPRTNSIGEQNFYISKEQLLPGDMRTSTVIATAKGFKPAVFTASINVLSGCSPLSILPCDELGRSIPVSIDFDANASGLEDQSGTATGLTLALPHSGSRLQEDGPATYPAANGYEASYITVNEGTLLVEATKGINEGNQKNQVNTLGIALENPTGSFNVRTRLLNNNMPESGNSQAGLVLGQTEDSFVKLVVKNGNSIELHMEDDTNGVQNILMEDLDLQNENVTLRLTVDQTNNLLKGSFSIDEENFITIEDDDNNSLALPTAFLDGRTSPQELAGTVLTGLFASYDEGDTSFNAVFDYYRVDEAILSIAKPKVNTAFSARLYPNPVVDKLYLSINQTQSISSLVIYDMQGRLINTYNAEQTKKGGDFELAVGNLTTGIYILRIIDQSGKSHRLKFVKTN